MFDIQVLIDVDDLEDQNKMAHNRETLDESAQGFKHGAKFVLEEILPYVIKVRKDRKTVEIQDDSTARYRVLKRHYE
jgi:hypothetical protein